MLCFIFTLTVWVGAIRSYALDGNSMFVDAGVTFGTKGFGFIGGIGYVLNKPMACRIFSSLLIPGVDSGEDTMIDFGADFHWYPIENDVVYPTAGISVLFGRRVMVDHVPVPGPRPTLWALNGGLGAKTPPVEFEPGSWGRFYGEIGAGWIISNSVGKTPAAARDAFLRLRKGAYFPNLEVGFRFTSADMPDID